MRALSAVLALLVLGSALAGATGLPRLPAPDRAANGSVVPEVIAFVADYGAEGWKDEPGTLGGFLGGTAFPALPAGYTGVYANPYASPTRRHESQAPPANWWGYSLTTTVELRDSAGAKLAAPDGTYLLQAEITGPDGRVPAKLRKVDPVTFEARFDLDGENGRADFPALSAGTHTLRLNVTASTSDPTSTRRLVAQASRPVEYAPALLDRVGVVFPEANLPVYHDVGAGNSTSVLLERVEPGVDFPLAVSFGRPNASVKVVVVTERAAETLYEGLTDAEGRTPPLTFQPRVVGAAAGALTLVEAHFTGGVNESVVGSAVLVLPVSSRILEFTSIAFEERALGPADLQRLDTVLAVVNDANATPQSAARQGSLVLVKGGHALASAAFSPESFVPLATLRQARYPADAVRGFGVPSYHLVAFFLGDGGSFYGLATAARGVGVSATDLSAQPGVRNVLSLRIANGNDNFNGVPDAGLEQTVTVRVAGVPGLEERFETVTVPEGGEAVLDLAFTPLQAGDYTATVNATLGDVSLGRDVRIQVAPPANLVDRMFQKVGIPGPDFAILVAGLAAASLGLRRRT